MSFKYKAFGLVIESVIEIPELLNATNGAVDVQLVYNEIPNFESEFINEFDWYCFVDDSLCFVVNDVARFKVSKGSLIEVDRFEGADDDNVRLFTLGSAIAAILHQRSLLPIHASAVEINGEAVLFSADSGFGKSTTCLAFQKEGFNVVSDDVCVLSVDDKGAVYIYPGYPQVKLWKESLIYFDEEETKHRRLRENEEKFGVRVRDTFLDKSKIPVKSIFFLDKKEQDGVNVNELKGLDKLIYLQSNIFRPFFQQKNQVKQNFSKIGQVANSVDFYSIIRPKTGFYTDEIIQKVLQLVNDNI